MDKLSLKRLNVSAIDCDGDFEFEVTDCGCIHCGDSYAYLTTDEAQKLIGFLKSQLDNKE